MSVWLVIVYGLVAGTWAALCERCIMPRLARVWLRLKVRWRRWRHPPSAVQAATLASVTRIYREHYKPSEAELSAFGRMVKRFEDEP